MTDAVLSTLALLVAFSAVGWMVHESIQDFILQPRRDAQGRQYHWCSGCDQHDVKRWDMAWTEDQGRWWCRKCRTGSMYSS